MIEVTRRKPQASLQVLGLEIRHLFKDLRGGQTSREEVEDVAHTNAHASHAGSPPTLLRIYRNPISKLVHGRSIAVRMRSVSRGPSSLTSSAQRYE